MHLLNSFIVMYGVLPLWFLSIISNIISFLLMTTLNLHGFICLNSNWMFLISLSSSKPLLKISSILKLRPLGQMVVENFHPKSLLNFAPPKVFFTNFPIFTHLNSMGLLRGNIALSQLPISY